MDKNVSKSRTLNNVNCIHYNDQVSLLLAIAMQHFYSIQH